MVDRSVRITSRWETRLVEPGTQDEHDPSLQVPTGWYVLGGIGPAGTDVAIHIHHAFGLDGESVEELVADLIAEVLRAATGARK